MIERGEKEREAMPSTFERVARDDARRGDDKKESTIYSIDLRIYSIDLRISQNLSASEALRRPSHSLLRPFPTPLRSFFLSNSSYPGGVCFRLKGASWTSSKSLRYTSPSHAPSAELRK